MVYKSTFFSLYVKMNANVYINHKMWVLETKQKENVYKFVMLPKKRKKESPFN
jgi:hypothetical protein